MASRCLAGALEMLTADFDAILAGAFGDPQSAFKQARRRHSAGNAPRSRSLHQPAAGAFARRTSHAARNRKTADIDFVVFRENTEGAYCGAGGFLKHGTADEIALQDEVNTRRGVERIIVAAFEYARANGRKRVTMADKSNVQRFGGDLWQRVFKEVAAGYPEIKRIISTSTRWRCSWCSIRRSTTSSSVTILFGDILTDLGAAIQGGLGLAASGNIHPGKVSLFEPVHGSAPPLAGKGIANPIGAILTSAMMLEYLGFQTLSKEIEEAVRSAISANETTRDLGGQLSTEQAGSRHHWRG